MAVDFVSELDPVSDLLQNEQWDGKFPDDFSNLLEMDSAFNADELLNNLTDDLELPTLPLDSQAEDNAGVISLDEIEQWRDLSDGSDSGVDCLSIKQEPVSPVSSHCSSDLSDLMHGQDANVLVKYEPASPVSSLYSSDLDMDLSQAQRCLDFNLGDAEFTGVTTVSLPHSVPAVNSPTTQSYSVSTDITTTTKPVGPVQSVKVLLPAQSPRSVVVTTNSVKQCLQPQVKRAKLASGALVQGVHDSNLGHVLGSKVKIQPRPMQTVLKPCSKPTVQSPTANKPLVLTPQEFAKLTSQGMLQLQPQQAHVPDVKPTPTQLGNIPHDLKTMKRQQRMIKNRESACQSRKRKKEYMSTLEERLQESALINEQLQQENRTLRQQLSMLQSENATLKKTPSHQMKKTGVVLMAVLFVLALNLGPLSNILTSSNDRASIELAARAGDVVHHRGRTLMGFSEPSYSADDLSNTLEGLRRTIGLMEKQEQENPGKVSRDLMLMKTVDALVNPSVCPTYFNSTESIRLMNELTGFMLGHKQEQRRKQEQDSKRQEKKPRKRYPAPRKLKAAMKGQLDGFRYQNEQPGGQYEMQVFTGADTNYHNLLHSIQRRNDTFYVVSFNKDHLFLPATAHNKTTRPRMSLVMPALGLNETMQPPAGSVAMMQIDCEVTDTQIVNIHKSAVPQNLQENATYSQHVARDDTGNHGNKNSKDNSRHRGKKQWSARDGVH